MKIHRFFYFLIGHYNVRINIKNNRRSLHMNISKRLQCIASKIPHDVKVADIGTDHAWVPIYLVTKGVSDFVIASDVRKGPIEIANQNIRKYQLESKIHTRLGSGLTTIQPYEVDTAVIAGMGGLLMIDILEASREVVQSLDMLVLQPQLAQDEVRKWLHQNDFKIVDEDLIFEDEKWYEIIVAKKGEEQYNKPIHYVIGKRLFDKAHPLLKPFIEYRSNKYRIIMERTAKESSEHAKANYDDAKEKLKEFEEAYQWL